MSKRWWIVFGIAFGLGCVSIIVGIRLSGARSFLENMLPGAGVSLLVFAIAVLLIEGSVMTRESRVRRVASMVSREVAKLNEEIGITLVREIGKYLASGLGSNIDLYGDKSQDWKAFKRLLREVFKDAREVSARDLQESGVISEGDYLTYIGGVSRFAERVGNAMGNHLEVHAELVDLIERQRELNTLIQEANRNIGIWDKKIKCVRLAEIGDAIIDVIEACPRIKV